MIVKLRNPDREVVVAGPKRVRDLLVEVGLHPDSVLVIREPNFFVDSTNFVFAILSGVAFPITVLPVFLQPVAYALPTTYAIDLLRHYALGTRPLLQPVLEWVALAAFAVVTVVIGRDVFLRTEHRMRVRGTTGQH